MSRSPPRIPSSLFILGSFLVVLALALAIGAVRFEFAYAGVATDLSTVDWVVDYDDLTASDQVLVDAAIAGDRFVTDSIGALPGPGSGPIAIFHDGAFHRFTRRAYFAPLTPYGVASVSSAVTGLTAVALAFRRRGRHARRSWQPI